MIPRVQTAIIVIAGVFFLGMGGHALAAPAALARPFRIVAGTPESRSEIRAGAVVTIAAALAGMALGRLVSRLADKAMPFYPIWFYFCVEAITAAMLFAAS